MSQPVSQPSSEAAPPVLHTTPKKPRFRVEKLEERIAPAAIVAHTTTGTVIFTDSGNLHVINNGGGNSSFQYVDPVTGEVTDLTGFDPV